MGKLRVLILILSLRSITIAVLSFSFCLKAIDVLEIQILIIIFSNYTPV